MTRGYFGDISELKKHGGKIAKANKTIVPAMTARKFPTLEVLFPDGSPMKLPLVVDGTELRIDAMSPKATLLCLSFRANSQAMVESWTAPFVNSFGDSKDIHIYEISFIDSWFLSINPIKHLLLRSLRQPKHDGSRNLHRHAVYSFGDHYYLRKELHILNLLTGYIFLLDEFGRIRWQGFGFAQDQETSSLISCTNQLLEEQ